MLKFYSRKGRELRNVQEWAELFENVRYRTVLVTTVTDTENPDDRWEVSTVWLGHDPMALSGVDDSMVFAAPGRIFETRTSQWAPHAEETYDRWSTEAAALRGHGGLVAAISSAMTSPVVTDVVPLVAGGTT